MKPATPVTPRDIKRSPGINPRMRMWSMPIREAIDHAHYHYIPANHDGLTPEEVTALATQAANDINSRFNLS